MSSGGVDIDARPLLRGVSCIGTRAAKGPFVLENVKDQVHRLARAAVMTDPEDLPGLVALHEDISKLVTALGPGDGEDAVATARRAADLAESIVLRTAPDAMAAFGALGSAIEQLQAIAEGDQVIQPEAGSPERDLVEAWVAECEGMLGEIESCLLTLERTPEDSGTKSDIRRMLHTLKGECGVLSFHTIQQLCHEAESLLDLTPPAGQKLSIDPLLGLLDWLKSFIGQLAEDPAYTPPDTSVLLAALRAAQQPDDSAQQSIPPAAQVAPAEPAVTESIIKAAKQPAPVAESKPARQGRVTLAAAAGTAENVPDFLCEAREHIAAAEEALLALDESPTDRAHIDTVFRAFHTIKGVAGYMDLAPIVELAHRAEQLLDSAREGTLSLDRPRLDAILASCDLMGRLLAALEGADGPEQHQFERVLEQLSGNAAPAEPRAEASARAVREPTPQTSTASAEARRTQSAASPAESAEPAKARRHDQTVKVSTSRMDSLVDMVGELAIAQQMIVQEAHLAGSSVRIQRTLGHMGKMIRELQQVSMSLRMVNLRGTFQKMTRLVRDTSQRTGKQIDVVTHGEDVELDRTVVELITDPLVHMIRNACDHGVETPDERIAAGKPPTGSIQLRASHVGGAILIEIADDGRGLRRERLLASAREKGLLGGVSEESMTDSEVFELIFRPGFTTAREVSDISGRGVGMDVVRRNIESIRGRIEIKSEPGRGTTFVIHLPLTLAIIDGLVVRVASQRYVLPALAIRQSFRPRADEIRTALNSGEMIMVREDVLPIYRLARVLGVPGACEHPGDGLLIVVEADDTRFCLLVDSIVGLQQVVIKNFDQAGNTRTGVSGGAILGDGRVALILDISQIGMLARRADAEPSLTSGGPGRSAEIGT